MLPTALFFLACVLAVVWMCRRAPMGYEDETGFHYGEQPHA
jgi:hypothetical protein